MAEPWTIRRVLTWTSDYFQRKEIDSPRLTADLLLSHVLGLKRVQLYTDMDRPLNKDELAAYRALVEKRITGIPTHYLLGSREFYGLPFKVDPRVLIPRPETEQLVELALERLAEDATGPVLDLCTGSGCIAVALADSRPNLKVIATDASADALAVARENAAANGVAERVELREGDLFAPVAGLRFPLIASNPPYIASGTIAGLMREVQQEPRRALDGGADGLDLIRLIAREAPGHLEPGGHLLVEIGEEQGEAVKGLFEQAGLIDARIHKDFAGLDRFVTARRE